MSTLNINPAATQTAFPTLPDHKKVANDNADSHKQTENRLITPTHQDDLPGLGLSLGEISDEPGNRLSENTHDLESHLKTFMPEDKKAPLTLISLNDKGHLSSAITLKSDENGELTFQHSAMTPGGTLSETQTGSSHNADDKNDLLQTLNSGSFNILSEAKTDFQHVDNHLPPGSTEHQPVSHKKSILKSRQPGLDQPSHAADKVKKSVRFSPDTVTVSETGTDQPYICIEKKDRKIGNDCEINNLVIKKEYPSDMEESSVQHVTLGAGTTLNNISFESDFCSLTLKGNASGLEIIRVP